MNNDTSPILKSKQGVICIPRIHSVWEKAMKNETVLKQKSQAKKKTNVT